MTLIQVQGHTRYECTPSPYIPIYLYLKSSRSYSRWMYTQPIHTYVFVSEEFKVIKQTIALRAALFCPQCTCAVDTLAVHNRWWDVRCVHRNIDTLGYYETYSQWVFSETTGLWFLQNLVISMATTESTLTSHNIKESFQRLLDGIKYNIITQCVRLQCSTFSLKLIHPLILSEPVQYISSTKPSRHCTTAHF